MKKNINKSKTFQPVQIPQGISKAGWKVIFFGVVALIIGYFVLSKTDPAGQNWASVSSPFIILGGYALIGIGIVFPEKNKIKK